MHRIRKGEKKEEDREKREEVKKQKVEEQNVGTHRIFFSASPSYTSNCTSSVRSFSVCASSCRTRGREKGRDFHRKS